MNRLWKRIPVVVRAVVVGYGVAAIGGLGEASIFANLKFLPQIPWMLAAAAVWLWLFWRYANGAGWPQSTREARQQDLRAPSLTGRVWGWSLLAGSLSLISVVSLGFLTPRFAEIPRDDFKLSLDFSSYPPWTVVSILLVISVVSAVVEEAGYRGYMLSQIQRRHGWAAATLITGVVFFLDHHYSHAYATYAFLPFFVAVSAVHALLVYFTGSIRPSILLHAAFDFIVIPIQYGLIGTLPATPIWKTGVDSSFLAEAAILLLFGIAAVPAFRKLRTVRDRNGKRPVAESRKI